MIAEELRSVDPADTTHLFGLFGEGHLQYDFERDEWRDPALWEMVEKAIQVHLLRNIGIMLWEIA